MQTKEINSLVLAYLGDSIYENYIRKKLIAQKIATVKQLQSLATHYVSATAQAAFLKILVQENYFSDPELEVLKRARNTKGHAHPKGCDMITYKQATALEALLGYLTLENETTRCEQIMDKIWEVSYDRIWKKCS